MVEKRKLIEVALPLKEINEAASREKSIRHGHPSTLHIWWARRPLAAARAVLFAQLVDDPSSHPDRFPTEADQTKERQRLFGLLRDLVRWENTTNEEVLGWARAEIRKSLGDAPPSVLDPFSGGGTIPLEAQRLGLEAIGGDLNPVAVLLGKALVEIPPRFKHLPPVHPDRGQGRMSETFRGAEGLAEDIRFYGAWMQEKAWRQIGHLHPKVGLPGEGGEATVIAWLWARTVASPNPALRGAHVPLVRSFTLSSRKGHEAWVEPVVDRASGTYRFDVRQGTGAPKGTVDRKGARCILTGDPIPLGHIRSEGRAGRLGARLMAVVAEGSKGRIYLAPDDDQARIAAGVVPPWVPEGRLPDRALGFRIQAYGMGHYADLFTPRQLVALTTFSDLILRLRERVERDALTAGMAEDGRPLAEGGRGARAYADALATYLALAVDRGADYGSSLCSWNSSRENIRNTFTRQALPMVWDYAEANPFSESSGNWSGAVAWVAEAVAAAPASGRGRVSQHDARHAVYASPACIATDPPYYDNIGYADLADFFYVWLRRSLKDVYPSLFATVLVPKADELVATPHRFGGSREKAQQHFEEGLHQAFSNLRQASHPEIPLAIFYAFKQAEREEADDGQDLGTASTGWETMLEGLIQAGFSVVGTWPMRTERASRSVAIGTNALASSIVLVCRPRPEGAPQARRPDFVEALWHELPHAIHTLQQGNIPPVDLAQSAIGPGMAVFTRYRRVLEADGRAMSVRTALLLINEVLDAYFSEQEGAFEPETRWALGWFEQHAYAEGPYGEAETLSKAKDVGLGRLEAQGVLVARAGKVRLLSPKDIEDREPSAHPSTWEAVLHLATAAQRGERAAANVYQKIGPAASEAARDLAYRLFGLAERQGWSEEALPFNILVASWPGILSLVEEDRRRGGPARQERFIAPS